jgi:hypothetical protein
MSLANLIQKQKGQSGDSKTHGLPDGKTDAAGEHEAEHSDSTQSAPVETSSAPASPAKTSGLKFGIGTTPAGKPREETGKGLGNLLGKSLSGSRTESKPPTVSNTGGTVAGSEASSGHDGHVIDSLAELAESEAGQAPLRETPVTQFPDLIDVDLPERDLPADITLEQQGFVDQLNVIYGILHDGELFGQVIRSIMQELQEHPEYTQMLAPSDAHVMIRGLRESMGLAQIKKGERKRTSPNANPKKPSKSSEMDALLDNSGMDFS